MANKLREIRTEMGCRMLELTARCGVSASIISAIERYDYRPTSMTKEKIAVALDVPVGVIWPQQTERKESAKSLRSCKGAKN